MFRVVRLGGHQLRKARGNATAALDAADFFLYRDSSIAPLLDMRRRFKAVTDVLDAMIRYGGSLSRSVELTAQWDDILALGPLYLLLWMIFMLLRVLVLVGDFHRVVSSVHRRLSDFIHEVVVHRLSGVAELVKGGSLYTFTRGSSLIWFLCSISSA